jgi:uncharacterized protein YkwD
MPHSQMSRSRRRGWLALLVPLALAVLAVAILEIPPFADHGSDPARAKRGPTCPFAHAKPDALNQSEAVQSVRCLIDKVRTNRGKHALSTNGNLGQAAQGHTNHMVKHRCFSHQCPGEGDVSSRVKRTGYLNGAQSWSVAENIAAGDGGQGSPAAMMNAWMNSPPHRAAILSAGYEHVGVGMEHGTPSNPNGDGATYTSDFGRKGG